VRSWRIAFAWAGVGAVACAHQHGPVASGVPAGATSASAAASKSVISVAAPGRLPQFSHQRGLARQCGRAGGVKPGTGPVVAAHPGECLAELGCGSLGLQPAAAPGLCPAGSVWTVRDLVDGRVRPRERDLLAVSGRLVVGDWGQGQGMEGPGCGAGLWNPAIEQWIDGECYQVDLSATALGCPDDASAVCCDHLPMGKEVVFVGEFHGTPDPAFFQAELVFARQCLPRADQSPNQGVSFTVVGGSVLPVA
jgi:hypothetical protein